MRNGVAVDLRGVRYSSEQARDPREAIATIGALQSMLIWPDGRFVLRTSTLYPGNIEFRFRSVGTQTGEATIDEIGWRDGDALQQDDAATSAKDYADLRLLVPVLLACDALRRSAANDFVDFAGRRIVFKMVPKTGDIAEAVMGNEVYKYSDWRETGGIRQPRQITRVRGGRAVTEWTDGAVRPVHPADNRLNALPAQYRPPDDPGPLRATPLGAGAFRIDGGTTGYHTGFVVGSREIAIFDAPVSVDAARAVRAIIEQTAPGRRIAYVIVSHVHADHVAGLPVYADAQIIVGPFGAVAIRRQLDVTAPTVLREISEPATLDLGGQVVRVFPVDSLHASTMLVGFASASGAIFQGDLFYLPERGPMPPAFETGLELSRLIAAEGLKVTKIVGVHGRTGTMADLKQEIAMRPSRPTDRGCVSYYVARSKECRSAK